MTGATWNLPPDWVMVGTPWPMPGMVDRDINADTSTMGVAIIASKRLRSAAFEYEAEIRARGGELWDPPKLERVGHVYRLRTEMDDFVMIVAPDYASAFEGLWREWQPEAAQRDALQGRPALDPAPPRALQQ